MVFARGYRDGEKCNGVKFQGSGLCVCTCWGGEGTCTCIEWMWKPEVDTGGLPQSLSILGFDTSSITGPGAH